MSTQKNDIPLYEVTIEPCRKQGVDTLKLSDGNRAVYIHSKYDPLREAEKQAAELTLGVQTVYIIFGLGLGYLPKALLQRMGKDNRLVVFEPSATICNAFINNADNESFLKDPRVLVAQYITPAAAKLILSAYYDSTVSYQRNFLHFLPIYKELYVKECVDFATAVRSLIYDCALAINTHKIFSDIWFQCLINNTSFLRKSYSGRGLVNLYQGMPAVVVAAGPSLSKNIELLRELKGKALILAVDTAYRPLQQHGIRPDFVITIDAQPAVLRKFEDTDIFEQDIITAYMCATKVLENHKGRIASAREKHLYLDRCYDELGIDMVHADSGGSVACTAISLAHSLGADPIIMIGQDLAYTDNKSHIEGAAYFVPRLPKTKTVFEVDGYYGGKVVTTHSLNSYRGWIETFIAINPETAFINATEGGALIHGASNMPLREVIDNCCQKDCPIQALKEEVFTPDNRTATKEQYLGFLADMSKSAKYIAAILPELKSCIAAIDRIVKEIKLHGFRRPDRISGPYKQVKKLNQSLDKNEGFVDIILSLVAEERDLASAVDRLIHKDMSEEDILIANLNQYGAYFQALYEKGTYAVPLIEDAVQREKNQMEEWDYE